MENPSAGSVRNGVAEMMTPALAASGPKPLCWLVLLHNLWNSKLQPFSKFLESAIVIHAHRIKGLLLKNE